MAYKHTLSYHKGHPNPQLYRDNYEVLNGEWDFYFDFNDEGIDKEFYKHFPTNTLKINVPFPYQAVASGIGDENTHCDCVWYKKVINIDNLNEHYKLTFLGADYLTYVYINGVKVAKHEGAYDAFSIDLKPFVKAGENEIVLRCYDTLRADQIRGKQRWRNESFECFYPETNGLFKDVYLEKLNAFYIDYLGLKGIYKDKKLRLNIEVNDVKDGLKLDVTVSFENGKTHKVFDVLNKEDTYYIDFNEVHEWNFGSPNLYDIEIKLVDESSLYDDVLSYFGFVSVEARGNKIFINEKDTYLKLVLDQGYFPNTITSPTEEQIIEDIELMKEAGFNGLRKHQKIEAPLYYYYLDLIGLYVWQECPSGYAYSYDLARQVEKQIMRQIKEHISSPSIISYVIYNESWGIVGVDRNTEIQNHCDDVYSKVKKVVEDRFVVSNDGWEHTSSDLVTVHNYSSYKKDLEESLSPGLDAILKGEKGRVNPFGGYIFVGNHKYEGQPILLSEFAGIAFTVSESNQWGYGDTVKNEKEWIERYSSQLDYILSRGEIRGFCMTQTTDVYQEVNGVFTFDRKPKMSLETLRKLHEQFK